jgi:hypothetical protein
MWQEMARSFDLMSVLNREECVRRLRAKTQSRWFAPAHGDKPVVGHIGETSFRICKRIAYRNSFQSHLSGELCDEDGGCRVHCRFGMHPAVVAFMAIWFGVVLLGGGTVAIGAIGSLLKGHASTDVWTSIVLPGSMLACGAAMVGLGHLLCRNEQPMLVDFLRDTISAREP